MESSTPTIVVSSHEPLVPHGGVGKQIIGDDLADRQAHKIEWLHHPRRRPPARSLNSRTASSNGEKDADRCRTQDANMAIMIDAPVTQCPRHARPSGDQPTAIRNGEPPCWLSWDEVDPHE